MTKSVSIPLNELREIYQGIEALVFAVPSDAIALASWKEQLELRMSAARALGNLKAYTIDLTVGAQNAN
jgi:pantothenate kinase-related protein Tda10